MNCDICGLDKITSGGILIYGSFNKNVFVCKSCFGEVYINGARFNTDVLIAPVQDDSFELAIKSQIFITPYNYIKKNPKYVAFYRGKNIGAITHIAKIIENKRYTLKSNFENKYKDEIFKRVKNGKVNIIQLAPLIELKNKIIRGDSPPIQNRIYVTFSTFIKSQKIKDLINDK